MRAASPRHALLAFRFYPECSAKQPVCATEVQDTCSYNDVCRLHRFLKGFLRGLRYSLYLRRRTAGRNIVGTSIMSEVHPSQRIHILNGHTHISTHIHSCSNPGHLSCLSLHWRPVPQFNQVARWGRRVQSWLSDGGERPALSRTTSHRLSPPHGGKHRLISPASPHTARHGQSWLTLSHTGSHRLTLSHTIKPFSPRLTPSRPPQPRTAAPRSSCETHPAVPFRGGRGGEGGGYLVDLFGELVCSRQGKLHSELSLLRISGTDARIVAL
jgi:hypothetical protein